MEQQVKLNKHGKPHKGGAFRLPFLEKKVMVYGTVPRKHHEEAQKAVTELLKKWR